MVSSGSNPSDPASWEKKALGQLVEATEYANLTEKKYCFVWDRNGNVPMFFKYKGQLIDLAPKLVAKAMSKETDDTIAEYLRAQLVVGMRTGDKILIDMGKLNPDWAALTKDGVFLPDLVFNRTEWYKHDNYIKYVKDEENYSVGGLNKGMYRLIDDSFCLNICSQADNEEEAKKQAEALPNAAEWKFIIIQ